MAVRAADRPTLFNDILITLGVYALSGREVTTATVAAVLTVLGYSIYDTIIVFDRVRENMPLMPRAKFATIANISLWETMRRSLATTFITLLPVGGLLLFGGATLKDFAFALFIGIGLGACLDVLRRHAVPDRADGAQPEFRRRTDERRRRRASPGCPAEAAEKLGRRAGAGAGAPQTVPASRWPAAPAAGRRRRGCRSRRRSASGGGSDADSRPHGRAR